MNKSDYQKYLASREWAVLREQVRKRGGGRCERCLAGNHDQTHHRTYERKGHELLTDLQAVCVPCHEFLSGKSDIDPAQPKSSERGFFSASEHGTVTALCPACGGDRSYIRCVSTRAITSKGSAMAVRLDGSCGHTWDLCLEQHKGQALVWTDLVSRESVFADESVKAAS